MFAWVNININNINKPQGLYFSKAPFEGLISERAFKNYYSEELIQGEKLELLKKATYVLLYCFCFQLVFFLYLRAISNNFIVINPWVLRYGGTI